MKVPAVEGEYLAQAKRFRSNNQRGICEIHLRVGVTLHQGKGAGKQTIIEIPQTKPLLGDKAHQPVRATRTWTQQMESLGQNRDRRDQRFLDCPQTLGAFLMIGIGRIEEGDQGSSVRQDHRRNYRHNYRLCLRAIVSRMLRFASRAAATDEPPAPSSMRRKIS